MAAEVEEYENLDEDAQYIELVENADYLNVDCFDEYDEQDANPVKYQRIFNDCPECQGIQKHYQWCQPCAARHFKENFDKWSSGNEEIDNIIKSTGPYTFFEWIPYTQFQKVKRLSIGEWGKIEMATWIDGPIQKWNDKDWERTRNMTVVLKHYINKNPAYRSWYDFAKQMKTYLMCKNPYILPIFGISQDPDIKEYMLVTKFAKYGNLGDYMQQKKEIKDSNKEADQMDWNRKLDILCDISHALKYIHEANFVYCNLSPKEILIDENKALIGGLSGCRSIQELAERKYVVDEKEREEIMFNLRYAAPEILQDNKFCKDSNVYSFGTIMWEMSTEKVPFEYYNKMLISLNISQNNKNILLSPVEGTPECYVDLMKRCWCYDPKFRPEISEDKIVDQEVQDNYQGKKDKMPRRQPTITGDEDASEWLTNAVEKGHVKFISYEHLKVDNNLPIESGYFGSITKAVWKGEHVVLKRLRNIAEIRGNTLKAFTHELKIHMRMEYRDRIVRCLGISQDPETLEHLLVMKYANNGDLRKYLKENKNLSWEKRYHLALQIAEGLKCLHEEDIIHKDLEDIIENSG
ncbi:7376_t:CDS:2 [Acaulospora colombiana]|uniref:7376_t:CDS:1 n=1 Tax=Acaulospora colombiana TaxID=27376 RepID=A0ACA9K0T0_9GLOM|nr:7376_t:CDS:2 [Acaulospora colombiana]